MANKNILGYLPKYKSLLLPPAEQSGVQPYTGCGFKVSDANHAVFTKDGIIVAIYVNDLLPTGLNINQINCLKEELSQTFKMINLGPRRYYLEMQITLDRTLGTICLDQTKYIKRILQTFQMTNSKPVAMPIEQGLQLPPLDQNPPNTKL